jgi:two-component system, sensor histidine kinase and response regulator
MPQGWEDHSDAEKRQVQLAALEAAVNGIIISDRSGIIEWANPAFTRLTGYARDEIIGQHTRMLKSGKQDPSFYKVLWETISAGSVWNGELINRRRDGSTYIEEMTITPVRGASGAIEHFVSIKQDITARKNAEAGLQKALSDLEIQYRELELARSQVTAVINAAKEAMILVSPDDTFIWLNHAFELLFAIKSKDIVGRTFSELMPRFQRVFEDPLAMKMRLDQAVRDKNFQYKENAVQKWPQKRELEIYAAAIGTSRREHHGHVFVFRDVTHEREVDRMKSEFVSLASHELRTPLTSINGYVDMLLDGDAGDLQQDQIGFLHIVKKNTERLTLLVTDLLDVSKIEAGAITLDVAPLNLASVIHEVTDSLQPLFDSKRQKLVISLPDEMPALSGDTSRINQVMTNLLSNAYKYTLPGGTITVDAVPAGEFVRINVSDTGVGISLQDQKKLFTKFFRADSPDVQKVSGTGLGLWITRSLITMHGGEMEVASKPRIGSTFSFTLPIG